MVLTRSRHLLFLLASIAWLLVGCGPPAPAAVTAAEPGRYCEEQGYEYLIVGRDEAGMATGLCLFPDGSQCAAPAFLAGECAPGDSLPTEPAVTEALDQDDSVAVAPATEDIPSALPSPVNTRPAEVTTVTLTSTVTTTPTATPTAAALLTPTATAPVSPTIPPPTAVPTAERNLQNLSLDAIVTASSALPADNLGIYTAPSAIDGDLTTTWTEGVAGPGIGEWIELQFVGPVEIAALQIDVGYDYSDYIFTANNRVKSATLVFSDGTSLAVEFEDVRGLQTIPFDGQSIVTESVRLIIESVYPGSIYDDTCIAEFQLWGPAPPES